MDELEREFRELLKSFSYVELGDIPDIELYMDQVTTFMDRHLQTAGRNPEEGKLLTKTMINNYVKNDLLLAPEQKKYGADHLILLLFIYYMKIFLSIGDIERILRPVKEICVPRKEREEKEGKSLTDVYSVILEELKLQLDTLASDTARTFENSASSFADVSDEHERYRLQRFDLICRMCAEI